MAKKVIEIAFDRKESDQKLSLNAVKWKVGHEKPKSRTERL